MRKIFTLGIMLLFLGMTISSSSGLYLEKQSIKPMSSGNILYVGGNGTGNYSTIQDAIDNASDGDTVFVYNGTYPDFVRINKSISLVGENKNNTIIEGGWGTVVGIDTVGALVTGFTIRDCGSYYIGGIHIGYRSRNTTIIGNIFTKNIVCGISINGDFNNIENNTIKDNGIGIKLYGDNNTIVGNIIESNNEFGIFFVFVWMRHISNSNDWIWSNNVIKNNIITNNGEGIYTENVNNTLISNNLIAYNKWSGIYAPSHEEFSYKNNTWIENNTISNNNCGIEFYESNNSIISGNTIAYCDYGLYLFDCNSGFVYHNNFINNTKQAIEETYYCDECNNTWDNGYPSGGNYWSDYSGSDNYSGPNQDIPGSDGIGDTPYNISGNANNHDWYPLMEPYGYDTLPPITTVSTDPATPDGWNNWYVSDVIVTIKATDDWSGVNTTSYCINGGNWDIYIEPFVLDEDGVYYIEYYSVDNVGNVEEKQMVEFKIDQTSPDIELYWEKLDNWTVIFTAVVDDGTSGMNRVKFYLNDELQKCVYGPGPEYEWITEWLFAYRVVGLMLNPEVSKEYVRLYALIAAVFRVEYDMNLFVDAVAYDNAGNSAWSEISLPLSFYINPGIYIMKELTLPADYEGYIGRYFIRAIFYGRPPP